MRTWKLALCIAAALVTAPLVHRAALARLARRGGDAAAALASIAATSGSPVDAPACDATRDAPTPVDAAPGEEASRAVPGEPSTSAAAAAHAAARPLTMRVRRADVLRALARRAIPRGVATARGVEVTAAPGLETWLRPGDVVTHVAGARVESVAQVIAAALAAHAARVSQVSGRIVRAGRAIDVVVETPW